MYDITHFWDEADQRLRDEGYLAGKQQGFLDGQQQGFLDGQQQGFLDGVEVTVRGFIRIGLSNDQIHKATGFTDEQIEAIRRSMKAGAV